MITSDHSKKIRTHDKGRLEDFTMTRLMKGRKKWNGLGTSRLSAGSSEAVIDFENLP
jgi:hypothetical protein